MNRKIDKIIIVMLILSIFSFSMGSAYTNLPSESEHEGSFDLGFMFRRPYAFAWQLAFPLDEYKTNEEIPIMFGMGLGPTNTEELSFSFADDLGGDLGTPSNSVYGEHLIQDYALVFDQKQYYKEDKQLQPYRYAFDTITFPNRDEYRYLDIVDYDLFSFFSSGLVSNAYKSDFNTVNPLMRYANTRSTISNPRYNLPYPWSIDTVYIDCDNGEPIKEYYPFEYQPNTADIYDDVYSTYNRHSIYPNMPGAININYFDNLQMFKNSFSCNYPDSYEGEQPNVSITVKIRKNRLYVLMEEFLKDEYVDNEFVSAIANPYQILQNNEVNCEKEETYFSSLGGTQEDPRLLPVVSGEPMRLYDEVCYTSYYATLPAIPTTEIGYDENEWFNDTEAGSIDSDRVPNTGQENTVVVDYEEYLSKVIKYNTLRESIKEKNNILISLVEICLVLFSIVLVIYYMVQIYMLSYFMSSWIPGIINIYKEMVKNLRERFL